MSERDSPTHIDHDRLSLSRLIVIRATELTLRQSVARQLRGKRASENNAEIARLVKGIADLQRNGLRRLRRHVIG